MFQIKNTKSLLSLVLVGISAFSSLQARMYAYSSGNRLKFLIHYDVSPS